MNNTNLEDKPIITHTEITPFLCRCFCGCKGEMKFTGKFTKIEKLGQPAGMAIHKCDKCGRSLAALKPYPAIMHKIRDEISGKYTEIVS